jgi:hypothetical protein
MLKILKSIPALPLAPIFSAASSLDVAVTLSKERGRAETTTREFSWKIILPTATFDVSQE